MLRFAIGVIAASALLASSGREVVRVHAADGVLAGAGDIAACNSVDPLDRDEATAAILANLTKVPATATIATFGDNAYNSGRPSEFDCFNEAREPLSAGRVGALSGAL